MTHRQERCLIESNVVESLQELVLQRAYRQGPLGLTEHSTKEKHELELSLLLLVVFLVDTVLDTSPLLPDVSGHFYFVVAGQERRI